MEPNRFEGASTIEEAAGKASQLAAGAREKLGEVREKVGEYYDHGMEKARELGHGLEDSIRENPVRALLISAAIATGAGFLIGWLVRR